MTCVKLNLSLLTGEVDPDEVDADYYNINPRQTDINVHELWDYINTHKMNRGEYFANEFMVSLITFLLINLCTVKCIQQHCCWLTLFGVLRLRTILVCCATETS